jgi:rhodanese-related sulfurtransferase
MDIPVVPPTEAATRQRAGALLIDIRDTHEQATGMAQGAIACAADEIPSASPDRSRELVLICESGKRSLRAAEALAVAGYSRVVSVEGGTRRWRGDGLPIVVPDGDPDFYDR